MRNKCNWNQDHLSQPPYCLRRNVIVTAQQKARIKKVQCNVPS